MTDNIISIKKPSLADELTTQLQAIAAKATDTDRKKVAALIAGAESSAYRTAMHVVTPGMAAILYLQHNSHNREWSAGWTVELARRMKIGLWKRNNQGIGFYDDGQQEDGQHRLAAQALSGLEVEWPIVFGITKDAIDTVDGGRRRNGADHAGLDGITDARAKQLIVKNVASYLMKSGDRTGELKSEAEVKSAIEDNDLLLGQAIEIGKFSRQGVPSPQLKETTSASIAYLMLKTDWDAQRIREKLAFFQVAGSSQVGESDPVFVAIQILEKRRKKVAGKERLTTLKEMGIVVQALVESERGIKAIQERTIKAAVDGKTLPDPHYPNVVAHEAA